MTKYPLNIKEEKGADLITFGQEKKGADLTIEKGADLTNSTAPLYKPLDLSICRNK